MKKRIHVAYLLTTFPAKSETFLQREIECIKKQPIDITLYSLWGGAKSFHNIRINKFNKYRLALVPILILKIIIKKPRVLLKGIKTIFSNKPTSLLNAGENLIGGAFALCFENNFRENKFDLIHGTWATMPATAAILLRKLTGIPFSMGAHAYDIYKDGGDTFLKNKIHLSKFIHTSSESAKQHLNESGASLNKIELIRRGLFAIPDMKPMRTNRSVLRIISIGRLVEKKGFIRQLNIYKAMKDVGFKFETKIIGEGPLKEIIGEKIETLGLKNSVELLPWVEYKSLEKYHDWADVLLFTGKVAKDGDRDGLPNIIPEVMAKGIPVVTSNVSAIPEVIINKKTGILVKDYNNDKRWIEALELLADNDVEYLKIQKEGRKWVETHYDGHKNAVKLVECFNKALT